VGCQAISGRQCLNAPTLPKRQCASPSAATGEALAMCFADRRLATLMPKLHILPCGSEGVQYECHVHNSLQSATLPLPAAKLNSLKGQWYAPALLLPPDSLFLLWGRPLSTHTQLARNPQQGRHCTHYIMSKSCGISVHHFDLGARVLKPLAKRLWARTSSACGDSCWITGA
jgi:hypothetical protein